MGGMGGLSRFGMLQLSESSTDGKKTPRLSLIGAQEVNSGTAATICEFNRVSGGAIAPAGLIVIKIINNMDAPAAGSPQDLQVAESRRPRSKLFSFNFRIELTSLLNAD